MDREEPLDPRDELEDDDSNPDLNPITHVFALLWLCPEGDRVTFAEVLLRAVSE